MAFCVNCGSKLLENAAFCTECGLPISKAEASPLTPVSTAQPAVVVQAAVESAESAQTAQAADNTPPPINAEPVYVPATTMPPAATFSAPPAPMSSVTAGTTPAATTSSGLKTVLLVFAVIAVIAIAAVGGLAYFGFGKLQEAKESFLGESTSNSVGKAATDPCGLATKEEVSDAFGSAITSAVPHGNKCTYLIANSGNRGLTVAVFTGDAGNKFRLAVGAAKGRPLDLATGQLSPSAQQAAYAYGTLYFYQNNTFATLYMGGAYAGADVTEKAAAIARKMTSRM